MDNFADKVIDIFLNWQLRSALASLAPGLGAQMLDQVVDYEHPRASDFGARYFSGAGQL